MHFLSRCVLLTCALAGAASAGIGMGQAFPSPKSCGVSGEIPATSGKVVLYDFWGSWCGPCKKAMPAYEKIYQKYRSKGLVVVGVGVDREAEAANRFLAKVPHSFPVCFDFQQKMVAKVGPPGMPTAYLVGRNGKVIHILSGFHGRKSVAELEAAIEAAL
ncbi:TlpA disulfide reductase family protein [Haloferula sargassicola]|uniref:Thiol-disulfide oxidoreductase ResA n=1 Tax=Haloferula sargassicola TaxID=490096 RepID=A0ABP9UTK7_9BACT